MHNLTDLQKERAAFKPELPAKLQNLEFLALEEKGSTIKQKELPNLSRNKSLKLLKRKRL